MQITLSNRFCVLCINVKKRNFRYLIPEANPLPIYNAATNPGRVITAFTPLRSFTALSSGFLHITLLHYIALTAALATSMNASLVKCDSVKEIPCVLVRVLLMALETGSMRTHPHRLESGG